MAWKIMQGDVRDKLAELPEKSVQCVVTSPPYWGLRSYLPDGHEDKKAELGLEKTPEEYVQNMVDVFRGVWRVLRDDGTVWLNLGDSYAQSGGSGSGEYQKRHKQFGKTIDPGTAQNSRKAPPGLKPKDLVGIPWRVAFALQADGWWLRSDIIWCLSGGTRVYAKTQKGEGPMLIKDLVRLDPSTVQLWNGHKWTQVLGWSQTQRPDVTYEIELRSGERIGCTAGHIWPTQRGNVRADELRVGDVIQTCRLPEPENLKRPDGLDDEIVGWFVGLYIAEGSRSDDTIQIAGHTGETERFKRLQTLAEAYHGTCRMHRTGGNSATINLHGPVLNGIIDTYVAGRTAHDKHLHPRCWQRSNAFLAAILRGYLSGDGHYDKANNRYRIGFTNNDNWAADLRTLCARLGYSLRLKRVQHTSGGKKFPGYRGQIRLEVSDHHNNRPDSEVVAIRRSRARQFWDIGVQDEPNLFALASGVLTHNSKPNPMPESVTDRPTKAHEYIFLLTKKQKYFYDAEAIKERAIEGKDLGLLRGKSFVDSKNVSWHATSILKRQKEGINSRTAGTGYRNKRTVWTVATQPYSEAHFATFPPKLIEPCILAGTSPRACEICGAPWERVVEKKRINRQTGKEVLGGWGNGGDPADQHKGGFNSIRPETHTKTLGWQPTCTCKENSGKARCIVLDPFAGSGTTLYVAEQYGRDSVGIELSEDYCKLIHKRMDKMQMNIFNMGVVE